MQNNWARDNQNECKEHKPLNKERTKGEEKYYHSGTHGMQANRVPNRVQD